MTLVSASVPDTTSNAYFDTPGTHSYIFAEHQVYDTMQPREACYPPVPVIVVTNGPGTYSFDLSVTYTNSLQAQHYTLVVNSTASPLSSVEQSTAAPLEFSLMPNPARDEVKIALPEEEHSTVEIYDVLGNLVLRKEAMGGMVWSPKDASGIYIVRVTTRGDDGRMMSRSKRLVFAR